MNIGDVVQLKSGGPCMTVEDMSNATRAICVWFDNGKLEHAGFNVNTLKVVEAN